MGAYPSQRLTTTGKTAPLLINLLAAHNPYFGPSVTWGLSVIVTLSAGASLTYQVEITGDQQPTAGGNWNVHDTMNGLTVSANGSIGFPITAIRLNVTGFVSGSANMGVVQWP